MHDQLEWAVGLDPWIVQDGNYGDFQRGTEARFALEFYADRGWSPSRERRPVARRLRSCIYALNAEVVHVSNHLWVLDFGVRAYQEGPPPATAARVGDWVTGEAYVGVDHFAYFEELHAAPGAPALIYPWTVGRVDRETAPYVEVDVAVAGGLQRVKQADQSRVTVTPVDATDCWGEEIGLTSLHYVLHCRRTGEPGRSLRA